MGESLEKAAAEKTTSEKLMELLMSRFDGIPRGRKITETSSFDVDLEMDSLDKYEFSYLVDETFGVNILDEDIQKLNSIRDYISYIEAQNKRNY